ncbi:hypothetical protein LINGRAHAP2_LOCUS8827 [Linum grandiflorum]
MGGQSILTRILLVLLLFFLVVAIMCYGVASIDDPVCDGVPNGYGRCSGSMLPDNAEFSQRTIIAQLRNAMNWDHKPIACYIVPFSGHPDGDVYDANVYFSCNQGHDDCQNVCLSSAVDGLKSVCDGAAGSVFAMEHCCLRYETEYSFCNP